MAESGRLLPLRSRPDSTATANWQCGAGRTLALSDAMIRCDNGALSRAGSIHQAGTKRGHDFLSARLLFAEQ